MTVADMMFGELGYLKVRDGNHIYYNNLEDDYVIEFDLVSECIYCYIDKDLEISGGFNILELQAINKKVEELGWVL